MSVGVEVVEVLPAPRDERLWGANVEAPRAGATSDTGAIDVVGWALGRSAPLSHVELRSGEAVVAEARPTIRRDLAEVYPDASERAGGGFRARLQLFGEAERELELVAVLSDEARVPLGRIVARPRWRETAAEPDGMTLVSVVIPCYDQAGYLDAAIESVLAQTYPHFELVVVDDGSHDNTAEVAGRHPGVRLVQQRNAGLAAARNAGLQASAGELVTFLDADDRLKPDALEVGLRTLRAHPECAFVSGQVELTNADGSLLRAAEHRIVDRDHYRMLLGGNEILSHATVMYRRQAIELAGGFDPALPACEDYDLYLRIARRFPLYTHDHCVAEYRRHAGNMHRDPARMLAAALTALRKQRRAARRSGADRRAYALGVAHWRREFGGQLVEDLRDRIAVRDFGRETRRRLRVLMRYHRGGLRDLRRGHPTPLAPVRGRVRKGAPRVGHVRWGDLRRLQPIGAHFGFERGTPIDRRYIEDFLARHSDDVRGRVLEVGDATYTRRFGGEAVLASEVLHLARDNPEATIVGDIADAPHIPDASFDCVILTETLQLVDDVPAAIRTVRRILRPGGVLLATFPGMTRIDASDGWNWGFTTRSARRLFHEAFGEANVEVESRGNVLSATALLHGIAAQELAPEEIDHPDPDYPVSIHVRAVRPGRADGWWQRGREPA